MLTGETFEIRQSLAQEVAEMLKTVPGVSHADHKDGTITAIFLKEGTTEEDIINQPHLALRVLSGLPLENWHSLLTPHN